MCCSDWQRSFSIPSDFFASYTDKIRSDSTKMFKIVFRRSRHQPNFQSDRIWLVSCLCVRSQKFFWKAVSSQDRSRPVCYSVINDTRLNLCHPCTRKRLAHCSLRSRELVVRQVYCTALSWIIYVSTQLVIYCTRRSRLTAEACA